MRFLADECVHGAIVAALREAGHEVATVAPQLAGADDRVVLGQAVRDRAVPLTAEFRRLIADPTGAAARILALIAQHGDALHGLYVVITPTEVRVRRLPGEATPP